MTEHNQALSLSIKYVPISNKKALSWYKKYLLKGSQLSPIHHGEDFSKGQKGEQRKKSHVGIKNLQNSKH